MRMLFVLSIILALSCRHPSAPATSPGDIYEVSACGGFGSLSKVSAMPYHRSADDYCEAEVIRWKYMQKENAMEILHARNLLNCAVQIELSVEETNGSYELVEDNVSTEYAECLCYFDSYSKISGVTSRPASIVVEGQTLVIPPATDSGVFIIDTLNTWPCY